LGNQKSSGDTGKGLTKKKKGNKKEVERKKEGKNINRKIFGGRVTKKIQRPLWGKRKNQPGKKRRRSNKSAPEGECFFLGWVLFWSGDGKKKVKGGGMWSEEAGEGPPVACPEGSAAGAALAAK